jgi:2-polyprenyl-3-methyl-5-hydroxy-6-metoxy-1,4-benzoquinol methylase
VNFDEAAKTWDAEERRLKRADAVAALARGRLGEAAGGRALDFGCGTGLLSFRLRDDFREIVMLDTSMGMIEAARGKIAVDDAGRDARSALPGAGMTAVCGFLEALGPRLGLFDAAFSMMAMHHIPDTAATLRQLAGILKPGGLLLIVDLDAEDGSFHAREPGFDGHNGFDRADLGKLARSSGFETPAFETAWVERRGEAAGEREYPLFLMAARRAPKESS